MLGRIVAPHGVRGALRVQSYAEPAESLVQHRHWRLRMRDGSERQVEVLQAVWDGRSVRASLAGVADRDAVEPLRGAEVLIERSERPAPGPHEYYRDDLLGFAVRNREGRMLGTLQHFLDAPGGALMVIRGEREHWLPATTACLRRVDLLQRQIEVEWPDEL
ncbi:MAG TPA: ribosome maturation factor RimM [Steroidobacteraceae bacterium]|nr:ribosome maturation factor RimM [Steroidobacteraceae bacterium]